MNLERTIDDVVESVQKARERGDSCCLLVGAGCSVTAGIPAAVGFVRKIQEYYPRAYYRAKAEGHLDSYAHCMGQLLYDERRNLIGEFVDKAKINWAHIGIARLIEKGFVDRVLTTNFDPLIVRACSLLHEFPAVYDFATSQSYSAAHVAQRAVFHLHGQRNGFVLLNTEEEVGKLSRSMSPVFEDAGRKRLWIVVGYSGESDPVFEHLARVPRFNSGLFWITHKDADPAKHVKETLLRREKDAFFVKGFDADSFFISLAQRLTIFPPDFVARPFTYLEMLFEKLMPFDLPIKDAGFDVVEEPLRKIKAAIAQFQDRQETGKIDKKTRMSITEMNRLLMAGRYDDLISTKKIFPDNNGARRIRAWAYVLLADREASQALKRSGTEADILFAKVEEKFEAALKIKPDFHEGLYNWGTTLLYQADQTAGSKASSLLARAEEKFEAALKIKSDNHEALYNWGIVLSRQGDQQSGAKANALFVKAEEKFKAALKLKPNDHETLVSWGDALSGQAQQASGAIADALFSKAGEKFAAALKLKPDSQEGLHDWGIALLAQAEQETGTKSTALFAKAEEKFMASLRLKTDDHETLNGLGDALSGQAQQKTGAKADALFAEAEIKFMAALNIKPDDHRTLESWGSALAGQAQKKTGAKADALFAKAEEKFRAALKIEPDDHRTLESWGSALAGQARKKTGTRADALFAKAEEKFKVARQIRLANYDKSAKSRE